jgi:hypothetical protein
MQVYKDIYRYIPHFGAEALKALTRRDPGTYRFLDTLFIDGALKLRTLEQIHEECLGQALTYACM